MFTTLALFVFWDGAAPVGTYPSKYDKATHPLGPYSLVDGWSADGVVVAPPGVYNRAAPPFGPYSLVDGWSDGSVVVTPPRDLGVRHRRRAKLKHIQDEQRVEKDYLDSLNPKPAAQPKAKAKPAPAPVEQPAPVAAKPVAVVEPVPTVAEMAQSMKAMQAQLEQMQEALKKVEFENKYWARFATLMMQNTH